MAGTTLTYNGVIMRDCETLAFEQDLHYDASGTDAQFSYITIHVRGNVHRNLTASCRTDVTAAGSGRAAYALFLEVVRQQLMQPRKILSFGTDDDSLLYVVPPTAFAAVPLGQQSSVDVDNGPKPMRVAVQEVVGTSFYRVEFQIRVALAYCDLTSGAVAAGPVLSNRWNITEERDSNFFVTRTVEGTLRVKHVAHWPHWYRNMVVPRLPLGFRRQSMWFGDSPDGLALQYRIVDRQEHAAPPAPATSWHASYTEHLPDYGEKAYGTVHVVLDGAPDCNRFDLYLAALGVIYERLRGIPDKTDIPQNFSVTEHLHAPHVEATCTVFHCDLDKRLLQGKWNEFGKPFETDAMKDYRVDEWPIPPNYSPNQPSLLWYHYLNDPCGPPPVLSDDPAYVVDHDEDGDDGVEPEYDPHIVQSGRAVMVKFQPLAGDPQQLSPSQLDPVQEQPTAYSYYNVEGDYTTETGVLHLPSGTVRLRTLKEDTNPSPESTSDGVTGMLPSFESAPASVDDVTYNDLYSVVVPVHQPLCQRHIYVHAERYNLWPNFPLPATQFVDHNGIVYTLLEYKLHPRQTRICTDGRTRLYRAMMEYVYAMSRAPVFTDNLYIGHDPRQVSQVEAELFSLQNVFGDQSNQWV